MFRKLFPNLSSTAKLFRDIRNDNYKNWEIHFNNHNSSSSKKADPAKLQSFGLEVYEANLKEVIQDYSISDGEKEILTSIKTFFQLSDTDINEIKSKYAKTAVTQLSKQKLVDNQLTPDEVEEIGLLARELNISEEEVKRINQRNAAELYEKAVKQVIADRAVTVDEQRQLKQLAQQLGINIREAEIDKRLKDDYYYLALLNALDQGSLPKCKPPSIAIQDDEVAYWEISSNLVFTRSNTTGFFGHDSGVRLKVAKGVSYKLGSCRRTAIREQVNTNEQGVFVVTSKRVVFAASRQSFSIPFTQLSSFDTYADGIGLQEQNMELLLQFYDKQMSEVVFKVLTNAINASA
jgi:hypothetical protein